MRILHVNKFLYRRGGAEGYMLDVAARQREAGHDVRFFGMEHPENDVEPVWTRLPSHAEFEPAPDGAREKVRLLGRMMWSTEARRAMDEALTAWRPDVIHCHNIYHQLSPSVLAPARERGIPVVLTMHDYKLVCPTYQFLDKGQLCTACVTGGPWQAAKRACKDGSRAASTAAAAEVWMHRKTGAYDPVDVFIAPSRFLADQVRAGGVFPDRVTVLNNFTDVDTTPVQEVAGRGVVYAGRLSREKGVDTLIRSVPAWRGSVSGEPGPVLRIAGDGPARAELESLAQDVAPGAVRFLGRLPKAELMRTIRGATVSVVSSRWHENQPLSVLESFASGVPVVATTLGGLPEIVTDDVGWLVEADDVEAFGRLLSQVLDDPGVAAVKGKAARHLAETRFSPESHLRELMAVYDRAGAR